MNMKRKLYYPWGAVLLITVALLLSLQNYSYAQDKAKKIDELMGGWEYAQKDLESMKRDLEHSEL